MGLLQRDLLRLNAYSFQKTYDWEVYMPVIGAFPGELVAPLIQKVTYSDYEMTKASDMRHGAYQSFFVNQLNLVPFTITFLETELAMVKGYFASWKSLMLDSKGRWKPKFGGPGSLGILGFGGYAQDIVLLYLNKAGIPIREVKFKSAFPTKFYSADLDYATNEVLRIEIPFVCDRVEEGIIGTV